MKLHVLGTGNGGAIDCYNTCFAIENEDKVLLIDGGGGNGILRQIKDSKLDLLNVHDIFVTHNHTDHILGIIWILRDLLKVINFDTRYVGKCNVYASETTISALNILCDLLYNDKMKSTLKENMNFNIVKDSEIKEIAGMRVQFFDVKSRTDYQLGCKINDEICFCGDEPLKEENFHYAKKCKWLLHEAFCLESEIIEFKPYEKMHVTVKDAAETAKNVEAKNLVLWHTEDNDLKNRKEFYTEEAEKYYKGNVYVPNDLEVINLD